MQVYITCMEKTQVHVYNMRGWCKYCQYNLPIVSMVQMNGYHVKYVFLQCDSIVCIFVSVGV